MELLYLKQTTAEEIEKLQSLLSSLKTNSNSTKYALVVEAQSLLIQAKKAIAIFRWETRLVSKGGQKREQCDQNGIVAEEKMRPFNSF